MNTFWNKKVPLNYIYFFIYLSVLVVLKAHHVSLLNSKSIFPKLYFFTYALGESMIEVAILVLLSLMCKRYLPKWCYFIFIAASFLLLLTHLIDYYLVRMMDISIWQSLGITADESLENFIEMLRLTGIDMRILMLSVVVILITPFLGVLLYQVTHQHIQPYKVSKLTVLALISMLASCLLFLEIIPQTYLKADNIDDFYMTLPWKRTLIERKHPKVKLASPISRPATQDEQLQRLQAIAQPQVSKPNVFIFVSESLRADCMTEDTAPNLQRFQRDNYINHHAYSNANATQISWYAIFHANFPFHWAAVKQSGWSMGSLPLYIFKQLGYQVHVYSGAQLKYYNMDQLLFGKNHHLLTSYHTFDHHLSHAAWKSDNAATDKLLEDLERPDMLSGHVFIIFYDSTHFNYSWDDSLTTKYLPISRAQNQILIGHSDHELEMLKNRYKNAISYVDYQFHRVEKKLRAQGMYEQALIVFTGDHGEEFYEAGQLFHATHLSQMQIKVPIYYKLGSKPFTSTHKTTSHIDIFPTLLHVIVGDNRYGVLFDGDSLVGPKKYPYEVVARYNASRSPREIAIHDGEEKFIVRFNNKNIYNANALEVMNV